MALYPAPRSVKSTQDRWTPPERIGFRLGFRPSEQFLSALKTLPFEYKLDGHGPILRLDPAIAQPQGYRLAIDAKGFDLNAADEAGLFYGLSTLAQILDTNEATIPGQTILDWPDLPVRGYMLDVSRCKVPTMESLFEFIDKLTLLKANQLQLYTEHAFAYADHETVWKDASPFTPEEIRQIDQYCHERFIELVPNQNSFGHLERWLAHPEYKPLAECPDGFNHPFRGWLKQGTTLKPNEASLEFLDTLYDQLLPHFRSRQFNVGCDEPWELGQGWSQGDVAALGKHRVYLDFLKRIHERVSSRGYRMQYWGDIVLEEPSFAAELPENIVSLVWGYEADHPFEEQLAVFQKLRRRFLVAPGTSAWNTIGGRIKNARTNIFRAVRAAIDFGADGALLTDWGDFGHHQSPAISYPGIVWSLTLSWAFDANRERAIEDSINDIFLEGKSPELARSIIRLGSVYLKCREQMKNATLLNKVLFADQATLASLREKLSREDLVACLEELALLSELIRSETSRVAREIGLGIDLLTFACCKGLRAIDGELESKDSIRAEVSAFAERHEALWLERNRPGGLAESKARLLYPAGLASKVEF